MGAVYKARDPRIGGRELAIKVLRGDQYDEELQEELRKRFTQEANAAGRLRSDHIVQIFDVGEHEGEPFIAMEFIDGETLASLIKHRERIPLRSKLELIAQLCEGVAAAHASGIIHRDIKPLNLVRERNGRLKILDFGIAKVADSSMRTVTGSFMGSCNYVSPEQIAGSRVLDHRSDIFSMGAVFYELLCFSQAFPGVPPAVLHRITSQPPDPLIPAYAASGVLAPGDTAALDADIARIVTTALAKDPSARYQAAAGMFEDVDQALQSHPASAAGSGRRSSARIVARDDASSRPARSDDGGSVIGMGSFAGRPSTTARRPMGFYDAGPKSPETWRQSSESPGADPGVANTFGSFSAAPVEPRSIARNPAAIASIVAALIGGGIALGVGVPRLFQGSAVVDSNRATPEISPPVSPRSTSAPAGASPTPATDAPQRAPNSTPSERTSNDVNAGSRTIAPPKRDQATARQVEPTRQTKPLETPATASPVPDSVPPPPPAPVRVGGNIKTPRKVRDMPPVYPPIAQSARVQGVVIVEATIGENGVVRDARILRSIPLLDEAALEAVRQWVFEPTLLNGVPVPVIMTVTVQFRLE
jgi:TonB family protein